MATNLPITGIFNITCEFKRKGNTWLAGYHTGIDITCNNPTIYSTCNGEVTRTGFDKSYGNFVVVRNQGDGNYHWFCHLARIDVKQGQMVTRLSKLGIMGATGNATGVHLHYEIRNKSNKYGDVSCPAQYIGIENKVQSGLNSENYQIKDNSNTSTNNDNIKVGDIKKFKVNTNIREKPTLNSTPHLYKSNTTVEILETNVANVDGYLWDKVEAIYANPNDFKKGYVARTSERYQ